MQFAFDADEAEIISEAGRTLRRFLPRERFFHDSTVTGDWRAIASGGWLHASLPGEFGGAELPLPVIAGIARESGACLSGEAFVNNAIVIPKLLAATNEPDRLIAEHVESGGFLLGDGRSDVLATRGETSYSWCYGVEDGFVPFAVRSDRLDRYEPRSVSFRPLAEASDAVGDVELADAVSESFELHLDRAQLEAEAAIASAAGLVGLGDAALADTCEYVSARRQFGGPIGRFQAIKHELASVAAELEIAWNAVLFAALEPHQPEVRIARFQAARAAQRATRAMVQFFGGIGVTMEHHAHLYLKVAATSALRFGSPSFHTQELGRELLRGEAR
jgi:alkylation response protein AidB-like acyl-CoA dehydrogenase